MKKIEGALKRKIIIGIALSIIVILCCGIIGIWTTKEKNKTQSANAIKRDDKEFDENSKIKIDNLNKKQEENLFKLCKVWGFLKYYHPEVAKGSFNWDYELFRIMAKILEADNSEKVDKILIEWVEGLGDVKKGNYNNGDNKVKIQPSTAWIKDTKFVSSNLSNLLCKVESAERTGQNCYVSIAEADNASFDNEKEYTFIKYEKDQGYRLLMLFRYWNSIEYYFPYKDIMDNSWDSVLQEFIPKMINCKDELKYRLNFYQIIGKVQDGHAGMWKENIYDTKFFGKKIAAIDTKIIEDKLVVTKKLDELSKNSNINIGDVILKIDGRDTSEVIEEKLKYIPKANKKSYRLRFTKYLMRTNNKELGVLIQRGKEIINEKINCIDLDSFYIKEWRPSHEFIGNNIGYIYPEMLNKGEIDGIMDKFKDTKGLIIDLRCYPSDSITYSIGERLVPRPTAFVKITVVNKFIPGQFIEEDDLKVGEDNKEYYKGKVIVIINEETQSNPEFCAMAYRCGPNVKIIGSNSIGADGNVSQITLSPNIITYISGIGIYYPDGRETQRIGIIPDIEVKPTIEGIRNGRDELMEKAIELINN